MIDVKSIVGGYNWYCVIRGRGVDIITSGGRDIDILADSSPLFVYHITRRIKNNVIVNALPHGRFHVDILDEHGNFVFRFDIIDNLKTYGVNENLKNDILNTAIIENSLKYPTIENEAILRYLEYRLHPEKTKHTMYFDNHTPDNWDEIKRRHGI